ncbi:hypothetical protein MIR68_003436 [Amoeboaphelidium protococcarum]|nr:hypothetical protein MIR68_003436 [Amoeboaphelidium protococcarum]
MGNQPGKEFFHAEGSLDDVPAKKQPHHRKHKGDETKGKSKESVIMASSSMDEPQSQQSSQQVDSKSELSVSKQQDLNAVNLANQSLSSVVDKDQESNQQIQTSESDDSDNSIKVNKNEQDIQPEVTKSTGRERQFSDASTTQAEVPQPSISGKVVSIDDCIQRILQQRHAAASGKLKGFCLKNSEIIQICALARHAILNQPSLLHCPAPIKVVGDTHGQFVDLLRLFELCGFPDTQRYLFLGDYVDRGKQSLETITLLLCYKVKYPDGVYLLRGNHECANVNRVYGFFDECKRRCNVKIWRTFTDVFNCLPLAAVVAEKIFCVHGGLSPHLKDLKDIKNAVRPMEIPEVGLYNDLLWSDPNESIDDWEDNDRGVSYTFGKNVVTEFLNKYNLDLVCRAHMVVEDGYEFFGNRTLVTIFSAPNYCGEFNNAAAIMVVNQDLVCSFEILKPQSREAGVVFE